ncbi:tetratricopeptide (TPR) repeat protein [Sphingobium xenophagum]|uniref:Tetratricopeptide (TPR) repeat protein n=1 Tax=Sphingobium xenophagum TaxID=121428 RepID=A0ABU1WZD9_SPHXE|nr:hypothetical protein [Sphingobium xenophagum]MDR7154685.1 tetratricopeptide (TPR) repeat protein [Sphingobium xenophagum]
MFGLMLLLQMPSDIVVTGQRLVEAQAECVQTGCTPLRDAQATIALAEVQFRDGDYRDAKKLLSAAIGRNKKEATAAPRPVAALYEAYATIALHEGDKETYRRAVVNQVRILREHLPEDDPSRISGSTALGDMWIKLGDYRQAEITYRSIEQAALASGQDKAAMLAGMKRVWLNAARGDDRTSTELLDQLESRPLAQNAGYQTALRVLRLRLAARQADEKEITRLIAELGPREDSDSLLIWSPPYESNAAEAADAQARMFGTPNLADARGSDYSGIRWADIGFWVRPDGRTEDIEILRGSVSKGWVQPALQQIAGRRYSASVDPDNGQGHYRIERFTQRSEYRIPHGSLVKRRIATGGYDILDLTETPADPPA